MAIEDKIIGKAIEVSKSQAPSADKHVQPHPRIGVEERGAFE